MREDDSIGNAMKKIEMLKILVESLPIKYYGNIGITASNPTYKLVLL